MITHQELVVEIKEQLFNDSSVLALILYGSVSRQEECANSDIDLMVITKKDYLQKRHEIRNGITIEYVELHLKFLKKFISEIEVPVLFALADGVVLFDKESITDQLKAEAKGILDKGPQPNENWESEKYRIKRRSDLTEVYKDLLDIDDEIAFSYVVSLLISKAIPMLLENNKLWHSTRKKTMSYLESNCYEGYKYIETLLNPMCSLHEKRQAAKELTEYVLKPYGGILEGEAIIFRKDNLW